MGDADDSYDFTALLPFLEELRRGSDLVMGNRFLGGIKPGAMPNLHRYLGNPVLTSIGRLFFRSSAGDFHCGLRGFNREAILALDLRTTGMEFASEMVVKATLHRLRIAEVPTTLSPDGRSRPPHLRSWRDGWRHLRFLMLSARAGFFSTRGSLLLILGGLAMGWLIVGPRVIASITFDVHTLVYAALAASLGYQSIIFALFTKVFAISEKLLPEDPRLNKLFQYVTLEAGLVCGILMVAGRPCPFDLRCPFLARPGFRPSEPISHLANDHTGRVAYSTGRANYPFQLLPQRPRSATPLTHAKPA